MEEDRGRSFVLLLLSLTLNVLLALLRLGTGLDEAAFAATDCCH